MLELRRSCVTRQSAKKERSKYRKRKDAIQKRHAIQKRQKLPKGHAQIGGRKPKHRKLRNAPTRKRPRTLELNTNAHVNAHPLRVKARPIVDVAGRAWGIQTLRSEMRGDTCERLDNWILSLADTSGSYWTRGVCGSRTYLVENFPAGSTCGCSTQWL